MTSSNRTVSSETQLKRIYTNAFSMGNKQREQKVLVKSQAYDITGLSETWWDDSHARSAVVGSYRLIS